MTSTAASSTASAHPTCATALLTALGDELLRLGRRRAHAYPEARLDVSAFRILWVLSDGAPRTLKALADELDLEQSTVNRQVHAALEAGLLERYVDPGCVAKLLRPTALGRELFEHDGEVRSSALRDALADLGEERSARLVADLAAFNDAWDAHLGRARR